MKSREIDKILAKESAQLLEDLKSGDTGVNERLDAFLGESRRHVQQFLMMVALDEELPHLDVDRKWDVRPRADDAQNIVSLEVEGKPARGPSRSLLKSLLLAASLACALLTGIAFWVTSGRTGWSDYATAVGEQRAIELADGSIVHLNTNSHLQARITGTERGIRLLAGEALFKVHHDTQRPFRVHVGDITVQAVGTQFNVYRNPEGGATVAVVEGRVFVESKTRSGDSAGGPSAREQAVPQVTNLTVGQRAEIRKDGEVATERISNLSSVTDWQRRRLPFEQTPLAKIVQEFNRYNHTPRIVVQGRAADLVYSGIFDADEPERFLKLIEREPGLQVERNGDVVVIHATGARPES